MVRLIDRIVVNVPRMLLLALLMFLAFWATSAPQQKPVPPLVQLGQDGTLKYISDDLGNRVPDFSYCGYHLSDSAIPFVQVKVVVSPVEGDATETIQRAIDYLGSLPLNSDGIRGAILMQAGTYRLHNRVRIEESGIVIRGSGWGKNGTIIIADGISRETLFRIQGKSIAVTPESIKIKEAYVPVNASSFEIENTKSLKVGSTILITRPSTQEWIDLLGMNDFGGETGWLGWKPNDRNLVWDRTITAIDGKRISINAPITTALDSNFGGGYITSYDPQNRIENIGIENMELLSAYNQESPKDEEHCWNAISFEHAKNCWVRQVTFKHFAGSAVAAYETALQLTVEDCVSLEPVSEIAAYRRNTFFNAGQLNLFQRLYSEYGYHDFAAGFMAAGPNAFVQCESHLPYSFSGAIDSWASGVLFDIVNVDGHKLSFANREQDAQGAGWTAANSMFWQCTAARIENYAPPGAQNWAFGAWAQFAGNGYWYEANGHVHPRSLFYGQLADRIGKDNIPAEPVIEYNTNATSSPTVEMAAEIVAYFKQPVKSVKQWIEETQQRNPISAAYPTQAIAIHIIPQTEKLKDGPLIPTSIKNGWLVSGESVLTGRRQGVPWWNLNVRPRGLERSQMAITRYVPGRIGKGYTDDLDQVFAEMDAQNIVGMEQNYALWYERRRDDHERIRRMDADVWAPFYEVPFARSGQELAWDGLSKYDLTKYNPWYWERLKAYANKADQEGKILVHQNYFQHNILEAGAHWVDSPWRSVNNINDTDFPEPPPFAGDKRIFIADRFYDISHPVRRELHRKYIRQCLNNFKDNSCVIQTTSEEFTGPLQFVEFWLDVVAEWEAETGLHPLIALSTTKDVQDAILADPVRSKIVDIIDIRYWSSRPDGSVYAPKGGLNLAPRQHARLEKPGNRSMEQVYNDVLSYRIQFPNKAVMYSESQNPNLAWGIFMATGSLAPIPKIELEGFLANAAIMKVVDSKDEGIFQIQNTKGESIFYVKGKDELKIDPKMFSGKFTVDFINPADGSTIGKSQEIRGDQQQILNLRGKQEIVLWIHR